jgi:hypothetical protein
MTGATIAQGNLLMPMPAALPFEQKFNFFLAMIVDLYSISLGKAIRSPSGFFDFCIDMP